MERTGAELEADLRLSIAKVRAGLASTAAEHVEGIDESLQLLRAVVGDADPRDGRLAASDLLRHFREVGRQDVPEQHLHIHGDSQAQHVEVIEEDDADVSAFLQRLARQHAKTNGNGNGNGTT